MLSASTESSTDRWDAMTTKILIVDDEPSVSKILETYLRRLLDDFSVISASNGEEAIKKVDDMVKRSGLPDITLMDVRLSAMDGIECTRILSKKGVKNIHILSAYVDSDMITRAAATGVSGIIRKSEGYKAVAEKVADMARTIRAREHL
jgi:CheY-like chemotaxis protein